MNETVIPINKYDKILFSLFRSNKPVVKSYTANFSKTIAANMYQAGYYLQTVSTLQEFDNYLNSLSSHDTITLGVTQEQSGLSLTAKDFREGKDCIYRGKEHIKFCNDIHSNPQNLSLLLFDIDYDDAMPKHFRLDTPQEVRESLIKLFPLLEGVSMLIRPSSSAGIYNSITGVKRSQHNSYHVYIVVANSTADTNKTFLEFIKRRAWRTDVKLAYAKLTAGNSVVERYYIDLAVLNSAERLIVESDPILEVPLAKEVIPSVIYEGGALDLASIDSNLEVDYRDTYAVEKAKLIATLPITNKTVTTPAKSQSLATTSSNEEPILISEDTKIKIIDIYMNFQNTPMPKTYIIKQRLNDAIVSALITFLGFNIDNNYKFKLRDEKTPSCSISHNGYIKDFGGDFAGGIIDFIMHIFDIDFKMSWYYLRACFGQQMPPLPINLQGVLPAPMNFEKRLKVQDTTIGLIS